MAIIRNILVRVGADITSLQSTMQKAQSSVKQSTDAFKMGMAQIRASTELAMAKIASSASKTDAVKLHLKGLNDQFQLQQTYLRSLGKQYGQSVKEKGKDALQSQTLKTKLLEVAAAQQKLRNEISETNRKINDQQGKAIRGLNSSLGKVKSNVSSGTSAIKGFTLVAGFALAGLVSKAVSAFAVISVKASSMAIGFEAATQQIDRILGKSSNSFKKWADGQVIDFGIAEEEAVKYGVIYGNLISNIFSDQGKISSYTQQLLKQSAVVASATGREMTDVMDRIRSGLLGNTEAIEDLGINVNVAMLESTEAFKKLAKGKSWDQLNYKIQQQIRLLAILEQSTKKYGTEINKNTASGLAKFNAYLKNAQLNLGQAFLPVINALLPALTSFAKSLATVTNTFAQFMQALFGSKAAQTQNAKTAAAAASAQANLGNVTAKAGEKAKRGVAGFDEINQLQKEMAQNAEDAANTTPTTPTVPEIEDQEMPQISKGIQELADQIKKELAPQTRDGAKALIEMKTSFNELSKTLQPVNGYIKDMALLALKGLFDDINGSIKIFTGDMQLLNGLLKGDSKTAFEGIGNVAQGLFNKIKPVLDTITKITLKPFGFKEEDINKATSNFNTLWDRMWPNLVSTTSTKIGNLKNETVKAIDNSMKPIADAWGKITGACANLWDTLKDEKTGVPAKLNGVKDSINTKVGGFLQPIKSSWWGIRNGVVSVWGSLINTTDGIPAKLIDAKNGMGKKVGEFLQPVKNSWWTIRNGVVSVWGSLTNTTDGIPAKLIDIKNGITNKVGSFVEPIKTSWEGVTDKVKGVWNTLKKETGDIWDGIASIPKNAVNTIIRAINKFIDTLNGIQINIPSVDLPVIGKVGGGPPIKMPYINRIPELATGAVIAPNSPFLAMLGDQKSGVNIETPLETMIQAFKTAMAETKNNGSSGPTTIVLRMSETDLAKAVIKSVENLQRQTGVTLFTV